MNDMNRYADIRKWKKSFFDVSLFLYFVAYFFHYQNNNLDAQIRLAGTILLLVSGLLINIERYKKISTTTIWYFCFIAFSAFSSLWAIDANYVTSLIVTLIRVLFVGHFVSIRISEESDVERILNIYILATVYMCIRISILMANYYSFSIIYVTRFGDNFGYNSNTTSMMCLICILLCIHKFEIREKRLLNVALIIFFLAIMIATASKKGFFGLMLGVFLMLYYKNRSKRLQNIIYALFIIGGIYIACMTVPELYNQIGSRISDMIGTLTGVSNSSYSTESRISLIKDALSLWESKPIFGVGLNNFSITESTYQNWYTHCNYVEILADLGLVGFLVYYLQPFSLLKAKFADYNGLGRLLKTIVIILLIFDFAMVSYQEMYSLIFLWLFESVSCKKSQFVLGR